MTLIHCASGPTEVVCLFLLPTKTSLFANPAFPPSPVQVHVEVFSGCQKIVHLSQACNKFSEFFNLSRARNDSKNNSKPFEEVAPLSFRVRLFPLQSYIPQPACVDKGASKMLWRLQRTMRRQGLLVETAISLQLSPMFLFCGPLFSCFTALPVSAHSTTFTASASIPFSSPLPLLCPSNRESSGSASPEENTARRPHEQKQKGTPKLVFAFYTAISRRNEIKRT